MQVNMNMLTPSFRLCWLRLKLLLGRWPGLKRIVARPLRNPPSRQSHRRIRAFLDLP